MKFTINLKCGKCGNIINRIKILENLNVDNENVKKALKNKMLEFYNKYCMNCLNPVGDDDSIIMCKFRGIPKLQKLLETIKIEHKLCKNCIKITPSNCKICNLYHVRIIGGG